MVERRDAAAAAPASCELDLEFNGLVGCGETCRRRHKFCDTCLRCGQQWREHHGHACKGGDGARGSFPVSAEEEFLRSMPRESGEEMRVCGMCWGGAVVVLMLLMVPVVVGALFYTGQFKVRDDLK
eukprot:Rhum_TRINITY_DN8824_c0_g1::Rhum_TRINITY_DN8824_c0_g1_i1::g.30127::m.30127